MSKGIQVLIHRFFNDQFLIGVTGVIFNNKNEILLLKHTYRRVEWSLPGGYLKAKEHPKVGLEREIAEESGFKVKILKIITSKNDTEGARLDISYYGTFLGGEFKSSSEVVEYKFFPKSKLPKLITDQYQQIDTAYKRYHPSIKDNIMSFFHRKLF